MDSWSSPMLGADRRAPRRRVRPDPHRLQVDLDAAPIPKPRETFVFGYEEGARVLGVPAGRDKDRISAAVVFADLAAEARRCWTACSVGSPPLPAPRVWVSTQENVVRPGTEGAAEIAKAMLRLAERRRVRSEGSGSPR